MSDYFRYPMPVVQALGLVAVPTSEERDAGWTQCKPVAAAVLTMTQRDDGHVMILHETMSAEEETQFPLPWLIEQELIAGATTLAAGDDAQLLLADAAQQRFFVEPKLATLPLTGHLVDVAALAGEGISETALCRRLGIPLLAIDPVEAGRVWSGYPRATRTAMLCGLALARSVSRLMLWANLTATRTAEPGWFYETMLALRSWLDERGTDAPELYLWGTSRPVMRAVSFAQDYRRDLGRRASGLESDWPSFQPGLFHS